MRTRARFAGLAGVLLTVAVSFPATLLAAPVQLPFSDTFPSGTLGANWAVTAPTVDLQNSDRVATYAARLVGGDSDPAVLSVSVLGSRNYTNVWVHMCAKPSRFAAPPTDPLGADVACAFYVDSDGNLKAWDNTGYVDTLKDITDTNAWVTFVAHLDYRSKRWELYYTASPYATDATLTLAKGDMKFSSGYTTSPSELAGVGVSSGSRALLDNVAVQAGFTPVLTSPASSIPVKATTFTANQHELIPLAGSTFSETADPSDNSLAGKLGEYLQTLLLDNETVWVWDGDAWSDYQRSFANQAPNNYGWIDWVGDGDPSPLLQKIGAVQGIFIYRTSDAVAYTFGTYASKDGGGNPLPPPPTAINKGSPGVEPGFTTLVWSGANTPMPNALGFTDAVSGPPEEVFIGDQILLIDNGEFHRLIWSGTLHAWRDFQGNPYTLKSGQVFWLYRPGSTPTEYTR